jgi:DNA-binding transcriptional LysR family regulator
MASSRLAGLKPGIFIESRTPHTLLALAEAGHGVAIVPSVLPTSRYRLRIARITGAGRCGCRSRSRRLAGALLEPARRLGCIASFRARSV